MISNANDVSHISRHPKFIEMVGKRRRITYLLSSIVVLIYGLWLMSMIFFPGFITRPLFTESSVTIGLYLSFALVVIHVMLSGFYTWWANKHFDQLKNELLKELGHD